jgi:subtilisin-like proprotein convertase family protein
MRERATRLGLIGLALIALSAAGASPASAKTKTATFDQCVSTALAIPDLNVAAPQLGVAVSIPVAVPKFKRKVQSGFVTEATAGVRITHTFDGDLVILLISPGGKAVTLANRKGADGDGYGTGAASCAGSLVSFSDLAGLSIVAPGNIGNNPLTGSFRPESPLAAVNGGPAAGNWTLLVFDQASADMGALHAFSLSLTYTYNVKAKKKRK